MRGGFPVRGDPATLQDLVLITLYCAGGGPAAGLHRNGCIGTACLLALEHCIETRVDRSLANGCVIFGPRKLAVESQLTVAIAGAFREPAGGRAFINYPGGSLPLGS